MVLETRWTRASSLWQAQTPHHFDTYLYPSWPNQALLSRNWCLSICNRRCFIPALWRWEMEASRLCFEKPFRCWAQLCHLWQRVTLCHSRTGRMAPCTGGNQAQNWDPQWPSKPHLLSHCTEPQSLSSMLVTLPFLFQLWIDPLSWLSFSQTWCTL